MADINPHSSTPSEKLKIYFLPNLMTAGNLFCGFYALTRIVGYDMTDASFKDIKLALLFILLACVFDLLDGRLARMGGHESPFGREFDSLADVISFGVAPAFLVHRIVLRDVFPLNPELGWFIASIYLICGAFRLARFNCLATEAGSGGGKEFLGFPIPAAAGLVASLTLLMIALSDKDFATSRWRYILPILMLFLSWMMVSEVKYPTFKKIDLRTTRTFTKMLIVILFFGSFFFLRPVVVFVLPAAFSAYLIYGFVRPRISRKVRHEIEDDDDDDDEDEEEPARS